MCRRALSHSCSSRLVMLLAAAVAVAEMPAVAQVRSADLPRVEFTLSPGGAIAFTQEQPEPGFTNFRLGAAVTVNLARFIAFEAEAGASSAISRSFAFEIEADDRHPTTLDYHANLVLNLRTDSQVVPYLTGGVGAITLFNREQLGLDHNENYFTGNVGGGVRWLPRNRRWGLRADYRLLAVRSKSDAPAFFGRTNRNGHRLYGAMIVILGKAE